MDFSLTFAVLLYFNIFFFGFYALLEFVLLILKAFRLTNLYNSKVLINELAVLTFMVIIESVRLMMGQACPNNDFHKNLKLVFRILVLTVPSMYSVTYFIMWQAFVSRLELCMGIIMLIVQFCQILSSFFLIARQFRRGERQHIN